MSSLQALLSKPMVWTFAEGASLVGLGLRTFQRRVQSGEITGHVRVWYIRPPGSSHAYSKHRGYVSSAALVAWMQAQEAKTAERRQAADADKARAEASGTTRQRPSGRARTGRRRGNRGNPSTPSLDISLGCS